MKRSIIGPSLLVGLSLELVSISAMAQATNNNLVQNGSFEAGYENTTQINGGWPNNHGFWAPIGYFGATDTIPGWTVSGGGVDWQDSDVSVPNSMIAADSERMVDLNSCCGNPPGVISQTIATTPGVSYTLSFSYSGHPYSPCYFGPKTLRASAGSASTVVSADPLAEGYLDSTNLWHAASVNFTALSSSTVISFASLENDGTCAGPLVDNVWVLAQPPTEQVTCPCSSIAQFNTILEGLNYCFDVGGALITSIEPPVGTNPLLLREAAGGNTPGAGDQCGFLQWDVPGIVLTVTPEEAAVCTELVRAAAASRGVACL
jgi:hypothetical protein